MNGLFHSRIKASKNCKIRKWFSPPPSAKQTKRQNGPSREKKSSKANNTKLRFLRMKIRRWPYINLQSKNQCLKTWENTHVPSMRFKLVHTWMLKVGSCFFYVFSQPLWHRHHGSSDPLIVNITNFLSIFDQKRNFFYIYFSLRRYNIHSKNAISLNLIESKSI